MLELTPQQTEVNRQLQRLDAASRDYESRWGLGVLETLVPPTLAEKWQKQWVKVNAAILENDDLSIPGLVDGTIRGWKALEDAAKSAGHNPAQKEVWQLEIEGQGYAVVKSNLDAQAVMQQLPGVKVLTVEELIRSYHHKIKEIYKIEPKPESKADKDLFKNGGDPLPF